MRRKLHYVFHVSLLLAYAVTYRLLYQSVGLKVDSRPGLADPLTNLSIFGALAAVRLLRGGFTLEPIALGIIAFLGSALYPGLLPSGAHLGERLLVLLTAPGWIAALPLNGLLSETVGRASAVLTPKRRARVASWWLFTLQWAMMAGLWLGQWWVLRPYSSQLGTADLAAWLEIFSGGPWPLPRPTVTAVLVLFGMATVFMAVGVMASQGMGQTTIAVKTALFVVLLFIPVWQGYWDRGEVVWNVQEYTLLWVGATKELRFWILLLAATLLIRPLCKTPSLAMKRIGWWTDQGLKTLSTPTGGVRILVPFPTVPVSTQGAAPSVTLDPIRAQASKEEQSADGEVDAAAAPEQSEAAQRTPVYREARAELDKLVGLSSVKQTVRELLAFVRISQEKRKRGLHTDPLTLHMVFTGRPGTGKTAVARIVARLLYGIGLLEKGHLVEVDRSKLVGQWIGETAVKTNAQIQQAMGGVLFIDEAYSLVPRDSSGRDFGFEAIDTLLKAMEDQRDRFVVILAGYSDQMDRIWAANPGLKSRIRYHIDFPDYSIDEMLTILNGMARSHGLELAEDAFLAVRARLERAAANPEFANARTVRNMLESMITAQSVRLCASDPEQLTDHALRLICAADIPRPTTSAPPFAEPRENDHERD